MNFEIRAPFIPEVNNNEFFNKKDISFSIVPQAACKDVGRNAHLFDGFESKNTNVDR